MYQAEADRYNAAVWWSIGGAVHSAWDIKYHIIWIMKYRYKVQGRGSGACLRTDPADLPKC